MASLRKAAAYSKKKVTPYTRWSKKKKNSFVKVVPPQKIVKFTMGKQKSWMRGKFPHELTIITTEKVQLRDNALEACRQYLNKQLDKDLSGVYFLRIIAFPHHIQRENKMLTGAGADRMQTGMQLSYGKSVGKAAILKKNSPVFFIAVPDEKGVRLVRKLAKQIKSKLPFKLKVLYEKKEKKE